jgi:hypothetical protein
MNCIDCSRFPALAGLTMCDECRAAADANRRNAPAAIRDQDRLRKLAAGVAALFLVLCGWCAASEPRLAPSRGDAGQIPERSVVPLRVLANVCTGFSCERMTVAGGSAVLFDNGKCDGRPVLMALTAAHCVQFDSRWGKPSIELFLGGNWRRAGICDVSRDASIDLALIWGEAVENYELACLASDVRTGDAVSVASMVYGVEFASSPGRVVNQEGAQLVIETDQVRHAGGVSAGSVFAGESGGGVFDRSGDLVGIVSSHKVRTEWESRAVSVGPIRNWLGSVWSKTYFARPGAQRSADEPRLAPPRAADRPPASPPASSPEPKASPPGLFDDLEEPDDGAGVDPAGNIPKKIPESVRPPVSVPTVPPSQPVLPPFIPLPVETSAVAGDGAKKAVESASIPRSTGEKVEAAGGFVMSGLGLAATIAAAVATGGAAWPTVVGPALRFGGKVWRAVQVVGQVGHGPAGHAPAQVPTSCFTPPPVAPIVVTQQSPPADPLVHTETRVAPVEVDHVSRAFSYAFGRLTENEPQRAEHLEILRNLMNQYLAGSPSKARV